MPLHSQRQIGAVVHKSARGHTPFEIVILGCCGNLSDSIDILRRANQLGSRFRKQQAVSAASHEHQ
jgi:hypothetical protein